MYKLILSFFFIVLLSFFSCQKEERFLIVWDTKFSNYPNRFCQIIGEDTLYALFGRYVVFNYSKNFRRVDTAVVSIFQEHIANGPLYSNIYTGIAIVKSAEKIQEGDPIYEEKHEIGDYSWSINNPYYIKRRIDNINGRSRTTMIPFDFQPEEQYQRLLEQIQANGQKIRCGYETRIDSKWITPEPTFATFRNYD